MPTEADLIRRVTEPSACSALLAILANRHHDVEMSWSQSDEGEPWTCRVEFDGPLYEDSILELIEWSQQYGGAPEHGMFRIGRAASPVASVRVWPA